MLRNFIKISDASLIRPWFWKPSKQSLALPTQIRTRTRCHIQFRIRSQEVPANCARSILSQQINRNKQWGVNVRTFRGRSYAQGVREKHVNVPRCRDWSEQHRPPVRRSTLAIWNLSDWSIYIPISQEQSELAYPVRWISGCAFTKRI